MANCFQWIYLPINNCSFSSKVHLLDPDSDSSSSSSSADSWLCEELYGSNTFPSTLGMTILSFYSSISTSIDYNTFCSLESISGVCETTYLWLESSMRWVLLLKSGIFDKSRCCKSSKWNVGALSIFFYWWIAYPSSLILGGFPFELMCVGDSIYTDSLLPTLSFESTL